MSRTLIAVIFFSIIGLIALGIKVYYDRQMAEIKKMQIETEMIKRRTEIMRLQNIRDELDRKFHNGDISISVFKRKATAYDDSIIRLQY